MFIENAYSGKTSPLRYVLAIIIIAFVYIFSTIPFSLALVAEAGQEKILEMSQAEIFTSLGLNTTLFYMLLPFAIAFFAILFIVKFIHHQKIKSLVNTRPSIDWRRVAFSFSLVSFFALLSFGLDLYFFPEKYEWNFVLDKFLILFLIAVLMIPLQTTAEELLFRGYFMQGLGVAFGNRLAPLLTTSISFGLLHIMNPEIEKLGYEIIIIYIATGLFLGIITLMDEGLELAIGFHAANNLIIALLVTSNWTAFQTHSIYRDVSDPNLATYIILPLLMYIIFGYIFKRKYKWGSWKSHLTGPLNSK